MFMNQGCESLVKLVSHRLVPFSVLVFVGAASPICHSTWNMTSTFVTKTKHGHSIGLSSDGRKYLDEEEQYDQ